MLSRHSVVLVVSVIVLLGACAARHEETSQNSENIYDRPVRSERSREFDVEHYRIELSLNAEERSFWGRTTITLTSLRDNLQTCNLDAETFVIDSVEDQNGQTLDFGHIEGSLSVQLANPLDFGESASLGITYSATDVDPNPLRSGPGMNFHVSDTTPDAVIATSSWPESARHWFPSYDHPNDRATQEVIATVRDDYKVLSNGRLVGVVNGPEPGTQTWHWSQEQPHCTYLFTLVAGPYIVIEDSLGELPVNYWVLPGDVENSERTFRKTPRMIEFFNREFGYTYPWAKYDQIVVPGFGGGMENTTATVLGHGTLHDERAEQDFPSHGLVAHEAAHMWWGDLVSYRAWQETWISESFATYSEYLFSKHDLGEDEGAVNLRRKKESYLKEATTQYIRPIVFDRWEHPADNFDSHTYPKGAVVLHMLRWVMGDAPFRQALTHFLHENEFQPVDTGDLQSAIKNATGQNVDWFFDQWVHSPGHPFFDVSYLWDESAGKLKLKVSQVQDTSLGIPVYRMPVAVGLHTASGVTSKTVWLNEAVEVFEFDLGEPPLLVRFDEGNHLLKEWTFAKSVDELVYQLHNDDAIGRAWAAMQLGSSIGNASASEALFTAAKQDPFWDVRRSAVLALAGFAGNDHVVVLKECAEDSNSKVRAAALEVMGETGDPGHAEYLKKRFVEDDSYSAQAEALRSLGKIGDRTAIDLLRSATEQESPRNTLAEAAQWALDQMGVEK